FFQAEDGIRDFHVTGVQTCALPICEGPRWGERRRIDCGGERRRPPNAPGPVKCCFDRQELGRWLANAPDRRLRHVWKQGSAASMRYRDPQVNYYVRDVERMATFYCE